MPATGLPPGRDMLCPGIPTMPGRWFMLPCWRARCCCSIKFLRTVPVMLELVCTQKLGAVEPSLTHARPLSVDIHGNREG